MSSGLNSIGGLVQGSIMGLTKGYTRSPDYSSFKDNRAPPELFRETLWLMQDETDSGQMVTVETMTTVADSFLVGDELDRYLG